jgi:thymidylate synthase
MQSYLDMMKYVLDNGDDRMNRTGVKTRSVFGYQWSHDMRFGFPLLTTKRIHIKSVIHELLWFLRGEAHITYLKRNGVTIWDEWADESGRLGPVYGVQWRMWNGDIDQIVQMEKTIRENPDSRRNIVTAWNPSDIERMKLPPCHMIFQVNTPGKWIDLHLNMRSADLFLGVPFNIASYGLLLEMLGYVHNRTPRKLVISFGDLHIYENHFEQCFTQLARKPSDRPVKLDIEPHCREYTSIRDFQYGDFVFANYAPHPAIKAPVAV